MTQFSKELIAASTIPLVLSILKDGDDYGYSIIKKVAELSEGNLNWKEGSLYPVLAKLEKEKLIKSYFKEFQGRKRKYYSINKSGGARLTELVNQWKLMNTTLNAIWKPAIW